MNLKNISKCWEKILYFNHYFDKFDNYKMKRIHLLIIKEYCKLKLK